MLISQFDAIIRIYNELYIKSALITIRDIKKSSKVNTGNEVIPKKIKDDYKTRMGKYEKFLDRYIEFGERFNREYGGNIVRTYREEFEEL